MNPMLLPSQSRGLSAPELERVAQISRQIDGFLQRRPAYIERHAVPIDFALPGGNWDEAEIANDFYTAYRLLQKCHPRVISNLRHHVQVFSGANLLAMEPRVGARTTDLLPHNADEIATASIANTGERHVARWRDLTDSLSVCDRLYAPHLLGEMGPLVHGFVANYDTCAYQERIRLLHDAHIMRWLEGRLARNGEIKIIEIGGGYGALAHFFKARFPNACYTIVDLPQSLLSSALYLSLTRPDIGTAFGESTQFGFGFVPNYAALQLDERFDLAINTISFSEMPEAIVRHYGRMLKNIWLADGGILFEQNADHRGLGWSSAEDVFPDFFTHRRRLLSNVVIQQGSPNLWSNHGLP